jgi:hypothetical protein
MTVDAFFRRVIAHGNLGALLELNMSRAGSGDTVVVKATSNVYTVLVFVATLAAVMAIVVVAMKSKALFDAGLFPM